MEKNLYSIIILFLLCLSSCDNGSETYQQAKTFSLDHFSETIELKGKELTFGNTVMKPIRIQVIDSFLITINSGEEKHISLFNLNTNTKIGDRITNGNGPEDMLQLSFVKGTQSLQLYDIAKKTLMEYDIQAFVRDIQPRSIHKIKLKQQILEDITRDKQSNIIAPLFRGTHRLALLNQQGEEIRQLGSYPETKADFTDVEKREMFQFSYTVTPDGRIILCYNWTDLIEIYSSEGILLHRLHGPDQFISPFQEIHKEKVIIARPQKGEQREGYYNPVVVGDTFFILYNGNKVDSENYDENSRQLFIFDWNGKPLKRLLLDQGILTFTVDSINKKIYGISSSPEFHIVSFDFDL